jgi:hypothetical protein
VIFSGYGHDPVRSVPGIEGTVIGTGSGICSRKDRFFPGDFKKIET